MTPVRYHEAAEEELLHEIGYLELRAEGLGRQFFAEVRRAEKLISQFPDSAEEIRPGIRRCILRKFRYSLITQMRRTVCLSWRWLTIAVGRVIGLVVSAVERNKPRPAPNQST